MEVYQWSTTAGSNTSTGTASIAEGCDPSGLNDASREMMAAIAKVIGPNGIGYIAGQGGTVTQATSKSTAVTLNKPCGQVTTTADALAAGATAAFNLNNSFIGPADVIIANIFGGLDKYSVRAGNPASGSCSFILKNETGGSLSEAVGINFVVHKGATS